MRAGKAPVSCIPCAKRKVRCDKQCPCCHCKRRPQDVCEYPSPAPESRAEELSERVVRLERVIRSLGADPNDADPSPAASSKSPVTKPTPNRQTAASVVNHAPFDRAGLLAENEEATYVESPMWYSWEETNLIQGEDPRLSSRQHKVGSSSLSGNGYVQTVLDPVDSLGKAPPNPWRDPTSHLDNLWSIFLQNVHPLVKIFFSWDIGLVIEKAKQGDAGLSRPEAALVAAISLLATVSVPEDECGRLLHGEKAVLLDHLQRSTENALRLAGYAVTSNKFTVQAFVLYLQAIRSRAHPAAVFSLMGVATRIAERMGLHREGEVLGLSVLRSEERRRMWWQLQYMELTVAMQVGTLSPNVMGKWDAKMPRNVNDDELGPETKSLPPDRAGLTSMSNCLWTYNVLQFHRDLRKRNDGIPSVGETTSMVDNIEEMLRVKFVQHCELLDPLHVNLHLGICQLIVATRRLLCQPAVVNAKISDMSRKQRDELLEIGMKNLDYCVLIQTNEMLKGFRWHNNAFFPWAAFIYVILEANHRYEAVEAKEIWRKIAQTYETHDELRHADHRQDVTFAARITASGWQRYQQHLQRQDPKGKETDPEWIADLYKFFNLQQPVPNTATENSEDLSTTAGFMGMNFEMDLEMIDWTAWDGAYMDAGIFGRNG